MMKLYLVQHGASLAKEIDTERPLSPEGQADVARMAAFLGAHLQNVRVVHSGKRRAEQTAQLLAARLATGQPLQAISGIAPNDAVEPFVQQLKKWDGDTLVVGHLPFMAKLVATLVTGSSEPAITAYRPGSVVCLEAAEHGGWQIQWMVRPELLAG
jgi:phosphohistidine phosphatase